MATMEPEPQRKPSRVGTQIPPVASDDDNVLTLSTHLAAPLDANLPIVRTRPATPPGPPTPPGPRTDRTGPDQPPYWPV